MAAVSTRIASQLGQPASQKAAPMDSKSVAVKSEVATDTSTKQQEPNGADTKTATNGEGAAPLAPPPKPAQSGNDSGDYFSGNHQNNTTGYNTEQNLFDSAFGRQPETPGGTHLPPVASLTSPAGQLTGGASSGGFNWGNGGSLRSGPLSPAMLSGPAGEDYFSTNTSSLRGGFPTPNESSLRTGLTPGGGGSMFPPAPSPNTQAIFNSLQPGFATPGGLDFHRTAMAANKKTDPFTGTSGSQAPATTTTAGSSAQTATSQQNFDQHDAANGLFMLAQAGTESQSNAFSQNQQDAAKRNPRANGGSISNVSDVTHGRDSAPSEEVDSKPSSRNKGKKGGSAKSSRKAEDTPSKAPAKKKGKANNGAPQSVNQFDPDDMSDDEDMMKEEDEMMDGKDSKKMTDEEKRKNFLERNRVAALKCRQRKKQWLANLQAKVEIFSSENDALTAQVTQLREEILNLKTILIAHKDCPIAQQQASVGHYIQANGPEYGGHGNPYGNFQPQAAQVQMGGPRRYS